MTTDNWFDDLPTIGELPPQEATAKLREVGEDELADALEAAQYCPIQSNGRSTKFGILEDLRLRPQPWLHPHIFGYSVPELNNAELSIQSASDINADHTLQNTPIQIILKQMYVEAYPGGGTHQILFNFEATHQLNDHVESLNFPTTQRVREKSVANINQPIFTALNVGVQGAAFRCAAVNVKNEEDERILKRLESPLFQPGLTLFTMIANPAIALFSELGIAFINSLANHYKNYTAQKFDLGLDFSKDSSRARLAEGYYLAIQIPESLQTSWDWEDWVYNPTNGQIVSQFDSTEVIPYNYLVFSVSRHQEK